MESTDARLARLRADIAAGTYAPRVDDVAEALVGWIARPEQFERGSATANDEHARAAADGRDEERRR